MTVSKKKNKIKFDVYNKIEQCVVKRCSKYIYNVKKMTCLGVLEREET